MSAEVVKIPFDVAWDIWTPFIIASLLYFLASIIIKSDAFANYQYLLKVVFLAIAIYLIVYFNFDFDSGTLSLEKPQEITLIQVVLVPLLFFDLLISLREVLKIFGVGIKKANTGISSTLNNNNRMRR
ncbi:MAG TPA: hypothetical protein DEO65_04530 [Bacillus bacterium]|uniref:hypothetical protein n=1 Tax=Siminovitchia fordii TaxID=254759 RepID=UPI000374E9B5|nr:hypothetical protein [Siminovitchia fordii]HBZ09142.1 hypothetical protein [Bacillus sp. (in: firmicutes)]